MGVMHMPRFNKASEAPINGRSLLAYYCKLFNLELSDFPHAILASWLQPEINSNSLNSYAIG